MRGFDARTGARQWIFHTIPQSDEFGNETVWDWDLPCAPILADITVDGREIKAVAQPTKQEWLYGVFTTSSGQRGAMLRAYDKTTGAEVGELFISAPQTGSPMTYLLEGVQHIVVAISGGGHPGELVAFRLPK